VSEEIHEGTLYVTKYVGPADEGDDRARWQFTLPLSRDCVALRRDEVVVLAAALANSAAGIKQPA
jgi:uncharacterized protein YfeS